MQPQTFIIGFDGMNRAGKGTQLELLQLKLREYQIPSTILRGDGSRPGLGLSEGDPFDEWWQEFHARQRSSPTAAARFNLWNEASRRLNQEFAEWKLHRMPAFLEKVKAKAGVLLLDRTIISRMCLYYDQHGQLDLGRLYQTTETKVTWREFLPDLVIHLQAPQETLLQRLDENDPKYVFRRDLLLHTYRVYLDVVNQIPAAVQSVIENVDATQGVLEVHRQVIASIDKHIPQLVLK